MADDAARAFARSTRRLRAARGWSGRRLAIEAGIPQQRVSQIEGHGPDIRLTTACAIAAALGTTVDAMTAGGGLEAVDRAS